MSVEHDPYEALSHLLAGDLSSEEEAALRARMAEQPELAAAWERLRDLPSDLAALPDPSPPPALNARVLGGGGASARPARGSFVIVALAAAAVAALALFLLRAPGVPRLVLVEGEQWVDGQALVLAAGVPVRVDGRARIVVEPEGGSARVRGQEVESMDWKYAAAAATGAMITVAVYEGSALVGGDGGETVEAGERWTSDDPADRVAARPVVTRTGSAPGPDAADPEVLRDRVAELEEQLAARDFEGAIQRGRIAAVEGLPQAWPEDLPPQLLARNFEGSLRDSIAGQEDLEILEVNCDEYPCYAIIEGDPAAMGPGVKPGGGALQAWAEGVDGEVGLWNMVSVLGGPEGEVGLLGVSLIAGGEADDDLSTRLRYRMDGSVTGWAEDIMGEVAEQDLDIEG